MKKKVWKRRRGWPDVNLHEDDQRQTTTRHRQASRQIVFSATDVVTHLESYIFYIFCVKMVQCLVRFSSAWIQHGQEVDGPFVDSRKQPRQRTQGLTLDSGHTPGHSGQERGVDQRSPEWELYVQPAWHVINTVEMKQLHNTIRAHGEASRWTVDKQCKVGLVMNQQNCSKSSWRLCRERIRSSREVNQVSEQIKTPPIQWHRSMKLPQVQYIRSSGQKGTADHWSFTAAVHERWSASRDAVSRESARTPPHSTTGSFPWTGRSEHREDAQVHRQVQMIQKMPSDFTADIQNMLMPGSSEAAVQSPGPVLQIERVRRLHQTWRPVDQCAHVWVEECPLATRDEARSKSERRAVLPERRRSRQASNIVRTEFKSVGTAEQPCNSARDTAEQEERTQQIASVIENLTPFCGGNSQRSWRTDQTERTLFLICYCCPESEAAMKTLMRVDTAREQTDRHFSQAREEEVACERETSLHRQQNALLETTFPWNECTYLETTITKWFNAEQWCWRWPEANHGDVNYHTVTLEESKTEPQPKSQWWEEPQPKIQW